MKSKEKLEELLAKRIEEADTYEVDSDACAACMKDIEMLTKQINELDKTENEKERLDNEEEIKEANSHPWFDRALKIVEVALIPVGLCMLDAHNRQKWTRDVCQWEKEETFRSTPGRQVGQNLFKWK